jgi:hypothetical protein
LFEKGDEVKALSLRQPWAWLVAAGIKDVENRTWSTKFSGRFYIHAGKSSDMKVQGLGDDWIRERLEAGELTRYWNARLDRGAIIGEATITDCRFRFGEENENLYSKWHEVGFYGFIIKDPILYDILIPCRGALGFFEPIFERGANVQ